MTQGIRATKLPLFAAVFFRDIYPSVANGANNGHMVYLDAEAFDYSSTKTGSEGFTVAVLNNMDIPIMRHTGVEVATGQFVSVAVTPTIFGTDEDTRRFTPDRRNCYFEDEITLRHFPVDTGYR